MEGQNANDESTKYDCSEYDVLNAPNDDSNFLLALQQYVSDNDEILLLAPQQYNSKQANDETLSTVL